MKILPSEIQKWHYFISWDNPIPTDSSAMHKALASLGKVTPLQTKISVALSPNSSPTWRDIRQAVNANLDSTKGNAFYVNLRSAKAFQIGTKTKYLWKTVS